MYASRSFKPVVRMRCDVGMLAKPARCSADHQKVAGSADAVAGEDAAGAIGAVRRRRQADEQQPRAADRRSPGPACPSSRRRDRRAASRARSRRSSCAAAGSARRRRCRSWTVVSVGSRLDPGRSSSIRRPNQILPSCRHQTRHAFCAHHRRVGLARERLLELRHVRHDAVDAVLRPGECGLVCACSRSTSGRAFSHQTLAQARGRTRCSGVKPSSVWRVFAGVATRVRHQREAQAAVVGGVLAERQLAVQLHVVDDGEARVLVDDAARRALRTPWRRSASTSRAGCPARRTGGPGRRSRASARGR